MASTAVRNDVGRAKMACHLQPLACRGEDEHDDIVRPGFAYVP